MNAHILTIFFFKHREVLCIWLKSINRSEFISRHLTYGRYRISIKSTRINKGLIFSYLPNIIWKILVLFMNIAII